MSRLEGNLLAILTRKVGKEGNLEVALRAAASDLGLGEGSLLSPVCAAYALLKLDFQVEQVSTLLSWQEFEQLAALLFRAAGFQVRANLVLTKPRAQIDVVAFGESSVLSVDCKHYRREQGQSALEKAALAQLRRSSLLRRKSNDSRPIGSVILSMSEPDGKFVKGVAVVPVRTLRSFLNSLDTYMDYFDLR